MKTVYLGLLFAGKVFFSSKALGELLQKMLFLAILLAKSMALTAAYPTLHLAGLQPQSPFDKTDSPSAWTVRKARAGSSLSCGHLSGRDVKVLKVDTLPPAMVGQLMGRRPAPVTWKGLKRIVFLEGEHSSREQQKHTLYQAQIIIELFFIHSCNYEAAGQELLDHFLGVFEELFRETLADPVEQMIVFELGWQLYHLKRALSEKAFGLRERALDFIKKSGQLESDYASREESRWTNRQLLMSEIDRVTDYVQALQAFGIQTTKEMQKWLVDRAQFYLSDGFYVGLKPDVLTWDEYGSVLETLGYSYSREMAECGPWLCQKGSFFQPATSRLYGQLVDLTRSDIALAHYDVVQAYAFLSQNNVKGAIESASRAFQCGMHFHDHDLIVSSAEVLMTAYRADNNPSDVIRIYKELQKTHPRGGTPYQKNNIRYQLSLAILDLHFPVNALNHLLRIFERQKNSQDESSLGPLRLAAALCIVRQKLTYYALDPTDSKSYPMDAFEEYCLQEGPCRELLATFVVNRPGAPLERKIRALHFLTELYHSRNEDEKYFQGLLKEEGYLRDFVSTALPHRIEIMKEFLVPCLHRLFDYWLGRKEYRLIYGYKLPVDKDNKRVCDATTFLYRMQRWAKAIDPITPLNEKIKAFRYCSDSYHQLGMIAELGSSLILEEEARRKYMEAKPFPELNGDEIAKFVSCLERLFRYWIDRKEAQLVVNYQFPRAQNGTPIGSDNPLLRSLRVVSDPRSSSKEKAIAQGCLNEEDKRQRAALALYQRMIAS